ncbi:precorrin-6Y C5,15-methyltransferase (decarboxylating) subunit CbiT [Ruminococcus sp. HUN007]|uniref:precorrin-6Y C5,15-methyltransferase (decarboxylating) subunit CbiT n=1 Tax=Ruminococcus sp. HUN007 TaxID=1514668 RepID=UPI0005D2C422|nr:precorrin-6Y C5,15-methyltransferase (decarboxylating) subunit CbiT [Ruminococcus sp. HUN007]
MKKVYVIGTGTNGTGSLTADAAKAIEEAELIIGATRMLKPYTDSGKQLVNEYDPERTADAIRNSSAQTAAVLFSGDISFFSGAKKLLPLIEDTETVVLPGISSFAAFCVKCGMSYEKMKFISLHGSNANIALEVHMNRYCFLLLDNKNTVSSVCTRLLKYGDGFPELRVYAGSELGYETEKIVSGRIPDLIGFKSEPLTVMITENPDYLKYIPSAISDDSFIRTKIPMTKAEVRGCVTASLNIPHDGICWDIGCGTGSVSVEMAYRCPDGTVYSFDKNEEAVMLTCDNTRRFFCDNVKVYSGNCPDCLEEMPAPDAVFIGGSTGKLSEIVSLVYSKNDKAYITATAVSVETLAEATDAFRKAGRECSITQIAVTRMKKVGSYTMPDAMNPVWIISGGKKCSE